MSGKPDPSLKLPPAEPHWPEIRAWLQANPQTLLDDRSLLEEIGLKPHGRNVVEFEIFANDRQMNGLGSVVVVATLPRAPPLVAAYTTRPLPPPTTPPPQSWHLTHSGRKNS